MNTDACEIEIEHGFTSAPTQYRNVEMMTFVVGVCWI